MDLSAQELQSLFGTGPEWTTALAELVAGVWSALLGCEVQANALPVATSESDKPGNVALRVEAFLADCEHPVLWEVDRALAAALIDGQVGADEVSPSRTHGVLTEIEQGLVMRSLETVRQGFNARPLPEGAMKVEIHRLQLNSASTERTGTKSDGATAVDFRIELLGAVGRLTWWLRPEHQQRLAPPEPEVTRTLTAVLAEFTLPQTDLADLAVGDIITTDTDANAPIVLMDEGGVAYPATIGRLGDFRAVQIENDVE